MTIDEAIRILGIEEVESPDALRRAYLRRVRHTKPEADPDGFRRLRAAYEMLSSLLRREVVDENLEAPDLDRFPQVEHRDDQPRAPLEEGRQTGEPGPGDGTEIPEVRERLELFSRLSTIHKGPARLALLRDSIRDFPGALVLRRALVAELARIEAWSDLAEALRQAHLAGFHGFLERLALEFPEWLTDEEITVLETGQRDWLMVSVIMAKVFKGRVEEAIGELRQLVTPDSGDTSAAQVQMNRDSMNLVLLALIECQAHKQATELSELRMLWKLDLDAPSEDLETSWFLEVVTTELLLLPANFPAELASAFARAARRGDLRLATDEAIDFSERMPQSAEAAVVMLEKSAILFQTYEGLLRTAPPMTGDQSGDFDEAWLRWALPMMVLLVVTALGQCSRSGYPAGTSQGRRSAPQQLTQPVHSQGADPRQLSSPYEPPAPSIPGPQTNYQQTAPGGIPQPPRSNYPRYRPRTGFDNRPALPRGPYSPYQAPQPQWPQRPVPIPGAGGTR